VGPGPGTLRWAVVALLPNEPRASKRPELRIRQRRERAA